MADDQTAGGREVLVDSNVILDVLTEDARWFEWSSSRLAELAAATPLVINPVIYAEVSIRFDRIEGVEAVTIGGSRAAGTADIGSDWDVGVYYRGAIDLTALTSYGEVGGHALRRDRPGEALGARQTRARSIDFGSRLSYSYQ